MERKKRKKTELILKLISVFVLLCGCGSASADEPAFMVYYPAPGTMQLKAEKYKGEEYDAEALAAALYAKPDDASARTLSDLGVSINSVLSEGNIVHVDLGGGYRNLTASDRLLFDSALVRTLTQLEDIEGVRITVEGEAFTDEEGDLLPVLTAASFLYEYGTAADNSEMLCLYFANESGNALKSVICEVPGGTEKSREMRALEALFKGPEVPGYYPVIPDGAVINSLRISDGVAYCDLSSGIMSPCGNVNAEVTLYAIVNTITEAGGVSRVQILIDGENVKLFRESIDISGQLSRNLNILED